MADDKPALVPLESVDPEGAVVWGGPAVAANKIYIVVVGQMVRITFAEQARQDTLPTFRTAISMSLSDALSMGQVMTDFLKQFSIGTTPTSVNP